MSTTTELRGTSVSKSVRTETTRGADGKVFTKIITTETTVDVDGNENTNTTEEVKEIEDPGSDSGSDTENPEKKSGGWKPGKFLKGMKDKDKKAKPQSAKDFTKEVVDQHNKHRKLHGKVGDLKQSKELDLIAQGWADHLASMGCLSHSTNTHQGDRLGENVASRWSSAGADYQGYEVVDQWYSEVGKYDYGTDHQNDAGHFSQVVWKDSKLLGTGKAFAKDGRVFVVCNYHPAGNMMGQFRDNVCPPKK